MLQEMNTRKLGLLDARLMELGTLHQPRPTPFPESYITYHPISLEQENQHEGYSRLILPKNIG